MPNTYSWVISQLECYPEHESRTDVVFNVHWRRRAADGANVADVYGSQAIVLDPDAPFTPYNQITKAQIEGWLENTMGDERIAALNDNLDKQLEEKKKPSIVRPALPWA
jgi:hypothetical protein